MPPPYAAPPASPPIRLSDFSLPGMPPPAGEPPLSEERPVAAAVVQVTTTASVSLLGSIWAVISGLLSAAGGVVGQMVPMRFLGQLLHLWGAPSSIGLQVLLQKLQLLGSGAYVAHPDMNAYKDRVAGLAWVTMRWTSGCRSTSRLCMMLRCIGRDWTGQQQRLPTVQHFAAPAPTPPRLPLTPCRPLHDLRRRLCLQFP
jgi:hypothetical protein